MTAAQLIQDVIAHNMFIKFIYFMCWNGIDMSRMSLSDWMSLNDGKSSGLILMS